MNDRQEGQQKLVPSVQSSIPGWPPELDEVRDSIANCVRDGSWGKYTSSFQDELEQNLGEYFGCDNVRLCSSGTIAIELALRGLGIRADDEVLMAGYDFPGNFRAVEAIGGKPVLIDVRPDGWTVLPDSVAEGLGPTIKAVIVSHLHGQLASINEIVRICREREIPVVEDACQVPGAIIDQDRCGSIGDVGVISFGGSKLLTAGRGGAIITNRADVNQRIAIYSDRGNDCFPMSQLQCAAAIPQLKILDKYNFQRLAAARRIQELLATSKSFIPLPDDLANDRFQTAFYKFPVCTTEAVSRDEALPQLQRQGIPINSAFRGFARRSSNRCRVVGELPNCISAAQRTMLIHHPVLLGGDRLIGEVIDGFSKVDKELSA